MDVDGGGGHRAPLRVNGSHVRSINSLLFYLEIRQPTPGSFRRRLDLILSCLQNIFPANRFLFLCEGLHVLNVSQLLGLPPTVWPREQPATHPGCNSTFKLRQLGSAPAPPAASNRWMASTCCVILSDTDLKMQHLADRTVFLMAHESHSNWLQ